jgi:translocation and assembly module TamB
VPLVADARLDLTIDTRGFFVQNNLATIQLNGEIGISGTPREPKLGGEIRVEEGVFKLPGLRTKFTRTRGSVSFSKFKRFPSDTPTLDVQSESDYRDPSGQEHLVTLTIKGPLSSLDWDLYTSSGLNKGQTMTMLLSGRTPEEFRKTLGDEAPVRDPNRVAPSTNPTENFADELLKDLAGDFISLLIEDKLRNLTTLDVARLEIGTGSIGFHGEKELFKNLRFLGDLEQTLRGRTVDVRSQYRLSDTISVEGEYLSKNFEEDSEEDISDLRLRAVLRYFVP